MTDHTFDCMGTTVRLLVADEATAADCRAFLARFDAALSRFRPDSELSRLNAAPEREVAASPLLRTAISSGLLAAELTGGLFDPTLTSALEANGYDRTRRAPELPLAEALNEAPPRRAATPNPLEPWRQVEIGEHTIARPPGLRLDTGGSGKGLAADLLAHRLHGRWAVDCGGDMRVGGRFDIHVRHPLTQRDRPRLHRRGRRRRHLGPRHAAVARPRRHAAPPHPRPEHARAGLDRPDLRDRAGAHRRRGRGAGQGRAAQRSARTPVAGCAGTAG